MLALGVRSPRPVAPAAVPPAPLHGRQVLGRVVLAVAAGAIGWIVNLVGVLGFYTLWFDLAGVPWDGSWQELGVPPVVFKAVIGLPGAVFVGLFVGGFVLRRLRPTLIVTAVTVLVFLVVNAVVELALQHGLDRYYYSAAAVTAVVTSLALWLHGERRARRAARGGSGWPAGGPSG
jgi:hypothetical protein